MSSSRRAAQSITNHQSKTILIVDDDDASRVAMQALFELDGYQVITAADGQDGLERLRAGLVPDAILLDLCMPRMDGFQFRAEQLQDPVLAMIPVVVYSAQLHAHHRIAALRACAYVEKPFDVDRIRRIFSQLSNGNHGGD